jgi:hypothetical protein
MESLSSCVGAARHYEVDDRVRVEEIGMVNI